MAVEILCVGIVVVDAVGMTIDRWPKEGSLLLFDKVELHLGGCPANTSVGLARMGLNAGFVGKVGNDGLGEFARNYLVQHGVDVSGLRISKNPADSTSYSFIMIPSSGDRRIYHTLGSNGTLSVRDIDIRLFHGPKWIAFEGLSLMPKLFGKELAKLLKAARKAGAQTAADTALNTQIECWDPVLDGCWPYLDVFFPSEEEAKRIAGDLPPREICRFFRAQGVKIAGVKLGSLGCALETDDGYREIPAFKVKAIDTLGAGDSFMAGFLAGMSQGRDPFEAALLGNATAAHCVQAVGATTGIPKLAKIEAFMKKNRKSNKPPLKG